MVIDGKKIVFVSILWVGNGFLDGMLSVVFGVWVGYVGLYCDLKMLGVVEYYFKMLYSMYEWDVVVLDFMLVIGNFVVVVVDWLKEINLKLICFVCFLVVSEGIKNFYEVYLDVFIYIVVIDCGLNDYGYILLGLGDVGDCMFGIK